MNAAVPNVGLLLIWFGLCQMFPSDKVTVARLFNTCNRPNPFSPSAVPNCPTSDVGQLGVWAGRLNLRTIIVIADIYRGLYSPAIHHAKHHG